MLDVKGKQDESRCEMLEVERTQRDSRRKRCIQTVGYTEMFGGKNHRRCICLEMESMTEVLLPAPGKRHRTPLSTGELTSLLEKRHKVHAFTVRRSVDRRVFVRIHTGR